MEIEATFFYDSHPMTQHVHSFMMKKLGIIIFFGRYLKLNICEIFWINIYIYAIYRANFSNIAVLVVLGRIVLEWLKYLLNEYLQAETATFAEKKSLA